MGCGFPRASVSLKCWIRPCLSELDKAMEKVRLWLGTGREACGGVGNFPTIRGKICLVSPCVPPSPLDSGTHVSFPPTDFVA